MFDDNFEKKISIIYADDEILIARKFSGLASAPLKATEKNNALYWVSQKYPQVLQVKNLYKEIEGGLLHRIDTDTDGLLLFALTDCAWENLYNQQKQNLFKKEYTAFCKKNTENTILLKGFPPYLFENLTEKSKSVLITSKFRNFGPEKKQVRPVLENENTYAQRKASNRLYTTEILELSQDKDIYKIKCKILAGYRHQVRCHLAWAGFPIINDKIYNIQFIENEKMQFYASKLEFYHPKNNQLINFSIEI